jgi:hypothetical protein
MLLDHTLSEEDIQGIWVNHVPRKGRMIGGRVGRQGNTIAIAMGRKNRVKVQGDMKEWNGFRGV